MKAAKAVPVLMYHHVSPNPGLVTVTPQTFDYQMAQLAAQGYTALSADRFLDFLKGAAEVPEKSVLITFDDGYLDNYVHAYPVLQRHGLHAVIFAVSGWIGEGACRAHADEAGEVPVCPNHKYCVQAIRDGRADEVMLRWAEIGRMEADGVMEIHSHTHSHLHWEQLYPDQRERLAQVAEDLRRSRETLQQRLGKNDRHVCWPWGYAEPEYLDAATQAGFAAQYSVARGINRRGGDPRQIYRIVAKDRCGNWLASRLWLYRQPLLGALYLKLRGK